MEIIDTSKFSSDGKGSNHKPGVLKFPDLKDNVQSAASASPTDSYQCKSFRTGDGSTEKQSLKSFAPGVTLAHCTAAERLRLHGIRASGVQKAPVSTGICRCSTRIFDLKIY